MFVFAMFFFLPVAFACCSKLVPSLDVAWCFFRHCCTQASVRLQDMRQNKELHMSFPIAILRYKLHLLPLGASAMSQLGVLPFLRYCGHYRSYCFEKKIKSCRYFISWSDISVRNILKLNFYLTEDTAHPLWRPVDSRPSWYIKIQFLPHREHCLGCIEQSVEIREKIH
jgi:hypothetical protein